MLLFVLNVKRTYQVREHEMFACCAQNNMIDPQGPVQQITILLYV